MWWGSPGHMVSFHVHFCKMPSGLAEPQKGLMRRRVAAALDMWMLGWQDLACVV